MQQSDKPTMSILKTKDERQPYESRLTKAWKRRLTKWERIFLYGPREAAAMEHRARLARGEWSRLPDDDQPRRQAPRPVRFVYPPAERKPQATPTHRAALRSQHVALYPEPTPTPAKKAEKEKDTGAAAASKGRAGGGTVARKKPPFPRPSFR
jgi:hypothetical protein